MFGIVACLAYRLKVRRVQSLRPVNPDWHNVVHGARWRDTSGPLAHLAQIAIAIKHLTPDRLPLIGMIEAIIILFVPLTAHSSAPYRFNLAVWHL